MILNKKARQYKVIIKVKKSIYLNLFKNQNQTLMIKITLKVEVQFSLFFNKFRSNFSESKAK